MRLPLWGPVPGLHQPVLDALALAREKHADKEWEANGGHWLEAWTLSDGPRDDKRFGMDEPQKQVMARALYEGLCYDVRGMRYAIEHMDAAV